MEIDNKVPLFFQCKRMKKPTTFRKITLRKIIKERKTILSFLFGLILGSFVAQIYFTSALEIEDEEPNQVASSSVPYRVKEICRSEIKVPFINLNLQSLFSE